MSDQIDTKQITWQDLEVAEEETIPAPKGILIVSGVNLKEWEKAVREVTANNRITVLSGEGSNNLFPSDLERMRASMGLSPFPPSPLCTPSRDPSTGHMEE